MKNKKKKKSYCYRCGAEEIVTSYIGGYESQTGKPYFYKKGKCSNYRFWNFLYHSKWDEGYVGMQDI